LSARYGVKWSASENQTTLVFNVLENKTGFDRELQTFEGTLWRWLGGSAILLLLAQTLLLRWGLMPLTRMAQEVERIEHGQQDRLDGHYPQELAGLGNNLNGLIDQERARQTRYRDALDDLAHSLKTPLAALQASLDEPAALPERVAQQVNRMNDIVVHQLGPGQRQWCGKICTAFDPCCRSSSVYATPWPKCMLTSPGAGRWRLTRAELAHGRGRCVRDVGQSDG
jgi:two-component system sensor histidine kinase PhoQ